MSGHFREQCIDCRRVVSECRCPNPVKEQRLTICPSCQKRRDEIAACQEAGR